MSQALVLIAPLAGILALLFAFALSSWIGRMDEGTERMKEIAGYIKAGARAFLKREYKGMVIVVAVVFLLIGTVVSWLTAINFVFGAAFSVLAGFIGMTVATKANVRTANAAKEDGIAKALKVAFRGGAVLGLGVSGLGLLGLGIFILITNATLGITPASIRVITGFSLGASLMALFGRVGGGIYTKAADIGADLVGKIEAGIPEDDPRNPAVIADNVGDNVGDVAGTGSDVFESYVGSMVAAILLAVLLPKITPTIMGSEFELPAFEGAVFPLVLSAVGLIASIIGILFVRGGNNTNPSAALNLGTYISSGVTVAASLILSKLFFGNLNCSVAIIAGLISGAVIGKFTEIFTSNKYKPVRDIAARAETGYATTIISGLGVGMLSTMWPILIICISVLISYGVAGVYGIALSSVGMLSTTAMVTGVYAYSPIADNAGGIAQMANLPGDVREFISKLDAAGNTTAAIAKGFTISSAALTALALFINYSQAIGVSEISLLHPLVIVGLFIGAMMPFLFASSTMNSVGKAANKMIEEVRRQFREDKGIIAGTSSPDYARCVDISTKAALREMIMPGLIAFLTPLATGIILGPAALGGMLAGSLVAGSTLGIMMANSGGAWDNAKKYIEGGQYGGKGGKAYNAAVVGDTVGDPFKDTSAPSISILIKLMAIVSVVFAPVFMSIGGLLSAFF